MLASKEICRRLSALQGVWVWDQGRANGRVDRLAFFRELYLNLALENLENKLGMYETKPT
jgi:hypothetical protein